MPSLESTVEELFLSAWSTRPPDFDRYDFDRYDFDREDVTYAARRRFSEMLEVSGAVICPSDDYAVMSSKACGWALTAKRPQIMSINPGVAAIATALVVEEPPEEMPSLLRDSILIRTKASEALYADIRAIAVYRALGAFYCTVFRTVNGWTIDSLRCDIDLTAPTLDAAVRENDEVEPTLTPLGPSRADRDVITAALRWVFALGALMDAQGTPLEDVDALPAERLIRPKRAKAMSGISYRTVRLSKQGQHALHRITSAEHVTRDPTPPDSPEYLIAGMEGWELREVIVRPFLRRQAYGPKMSLRRWVYVDAFASKRWAKADAPLLKTSVVKAKIP